MPFTNYISASQINKEILLKREIKDEPMDQDSLSSTKCAVETISNGEEDSKIDIPDIKYIKNINCRGKGSTSFNSAGKINEEMFFKIEIKNEPADDNLLFSTESATETFSEDNSEITLEDSKVNIKLDIDMGVNRKEKKLANFISANNVHEEIFIKSEIKEEPTDDSLLIPKGYVDDTANEISCEDSKIKIGDTKFIGVKNLKTKEVGSSNSENKINEDIQFEIKESRDENEIMLIEIIDDTVNASSNIDVNEISPEETKIGIDFTSGSFVGFRSADVTEYFDKREKRNKNILVNKKHTKTKQLMYHHCDSCGMDFDQLKNFKNHSCLHSEKKPYKCKICNKRFTQASHLNTHKFKHNMKPYRCDVCNSCFAHTSTLYIHKRKHTGKKPYKCDFCNKTFITSGNLNTHLRAHTGEKPYKCDVCNKSFSISTNLKTHKRTHTSKKPYHDVFVIKVSPS